MHHAKINIRPFTRLPVRLPVYPFTRPSTRLMSVYPFTRTSNRLMFDYPFT